MYRCPRDWCYAFAKRSKYEVIGNFDFGFGQKQVWLLAAQRDMSFI